MEFEEKLATIATKIDQQNSIIQTEEATKNAFIMPFIQSVLGYDIFDPIEVIPEFIADIGTKKGEKIDYAILKDNKIQILIECKKYGEDLNLSHASQLYRYFSVTDARIAILTNGRHYQFYTDLDAPNKMDSKPFLELDMLDIDDHIVLEIKKLTKPAFDISSIINAAGELKYVSQIKKIIAVQFLSPDDDFVKFFASKAYEGSLITQKVKEQFKPLILKAAQQYLSDQINGRLKSVITQSSNKQVDTNISKDDNDDNEQEVDNLIELQEELDGFNIVKAILCSDLKLNRIFKRNTKSYFGILLDDNNRKPICRLHFKGNKKYIGIFNDKRETKYQIEDLDDIYKQQNNLRNTISQYIGEEKK